MNKKIRIGLLGAGHLGKIHLKCILSSGRYELVGFYDPDIQIAEEVVSAFQTTCFNSPEELIAACDVVDIVTPTSTHFELASACLNAGKHVFIEKPVTATLSEAIALEKLAAEKQLIIQVGHVERFNPAFLALKGEKLQPMFIEAHRLSVFNPRGTDVSVILDLMIHDIDLVLCMVKAEVSHISASGVAVISKTHDICNARIEFSNGCVANMTASRISMKQMRKIRLFQKDAYISLDLLEKNTQILRLYDEHDEMMPSKENMFELETPDNHKWIHLQQPACQPVNAIEMELTSFADSIMYDYPVEVPVSDGRKALEVALEVTRVMNSRS